MSDLKLTDTEIVDIRKMCVIEAVKLRMIPKDSGDYVDVIKTAQELEKFIMDGD